MSNYMSSPLTPDSIDRLNKVNDIFTNFNTTIAEIGTLDPYLTTATSFLEMSLKELSMDIYKRN